MKRKIKCPVCGKWLFSVENKTTKVTVYIWCRRCQKERKIDIESL
jgi:transcription elongation factor Elf1